VPVEQHDVDLFAVAVAFVFDGVERRLPVVDGFDLTQPTETERVCVGHLLLVVDQESVWQCLRCVLSHGC